MVDITILERAAFNIKLNTDTCVFNVNLIADMEYNDEGFQEFLEYCEISKRKFEDICDSWRNSNLWVKKKILGN